jgi:hypothetical protein
MVADHQGRQHQVNEGLSSGEQDHGGRARDTGAEISSEFVVARGDGLKIIELIEEALDEIAFAVEREVAVPAGLGPSNRLVAAPEPRRYVIRALCAPCAVCG